MGNAIPLDFSLRALYTADYAQVVNGKFYINGGGWNRMNSTVFPYVVPTLSVIALLDVPFSKYNADHDYEVGLIDPDGAPYQLKVTGKFRTGAPPDLNYGDPTLIPLVVTINNFAFHRPGDYSFTFAVDSEELGRYPIRLVQIVLPPQFHAAPAAPEPS